MRDKVIALAAVASAGVAVTVGLVIGVLGGAFDDSSQDVRPPALKSDSSNSVQMSPTSAIVVVPPSPTWQVAVPTTAKPPTTTPERPQTTTRTPRTTKRSDRTTTTATDEDSTDEPTTDEPTTTESGR